MSESNYITKTGLVSEIRNCQIRVLLIDNSGCSSCNNSLCMLADAKSRYVTVPMNSSEFEAGDEVIVSVKPSLAYIAAFWLYGMPFFMLISVLIVSSVFGMHELWTGLLSLFIVVIYYVVLFLFRKFISKQGCSIQIRKR